MATHYSHPPPPQPLTFLGASFPFLQGVIERMPLSWRYRPFCTQEQP